jgi:hypothetical protein
VEILIGSCHYFSDNYIELLLLLFFCMTLICKICTVNLTNLVSVKFQITNLITHFGVQLADAKDVLQGIRHVPDVRFPVLTPNLRGFEAALAAGAKEVAVFASASESFSKSNLNCTIKESLVRYRDVVTSAKKHGMRIRGYVSCVVGCPVEGTIHPSKVAYVAKELYDMGCSEISLGDTIGVGTPGTDFVAFIAFSMPFPGSYIFARLKLLLK